MATFLSSPPFLSLPLTRTHHISSSQTAPAILPPTPTPQPQPPALSPQLSTYLSGESVLVSTQALQQKPIKPVTYSNVESTDQIATSLTRRFGIGAGLSLAAFLAFGVISEQLKTRLEVSQQEANTRSVEKNEEVVLPNGIRYYDLKVGGGALPRQGALVVMDLMGKVEGTGEVFVDTLGVDKKPLAQVMGSRPYSKGVCEGIEYVLRTMKAGGKRKVIVPPSLGFGDNGADLGSGVQIPPLAKLEYTVEVEEVSVAPA